MIKQWSYIKHLIEMPEWQGIAMLWKPNSETSLLALGAVEWVDFENSERLNGSDQWWFGYAQYDLKNRYENLSSKWQHPMAFEDMKFFSPQLLLSFSGEEMTVVLDQTKGQWKDLRPSAIEEIKFEKPQWRALQTKEHYIDAVKELQHRIHKGDIYEVNYCTTFEADYVLKEDFLLFQKLNSLTEAPYSCFLKINEISVLCASPESFIERKGTEVFSRPIKGTVKRGNSEEEDQRLKVFLRNDTKEKAENVMIVDLVRNDLSKIATRNSVEVSELFGIYSFKTVHHMISTVTCSVDSSVTFGDILKATFPMGSMTGAPKISAMKSIDELECANRGVYSGTIGVIQPNGDFDFNVVIRSLLYDETSQKLRCSVGGAITALCHPEKEYDECLLKAHAVMQLPFE